LEQAFFLPKLPRRVLRAEFSEETLGAAVSRFVARSPCVEHRLPGPLPTVIVRGTTNAMIYPGILEADGF
jgi:hypothetical protein